MLDALPVREPVLIFALVMWVLLVAPVLARRMRLPEIIGLILAGILLGEHGLNILERNETIILLGTVGLLYIMFLAGLEIDLDQFVRQRRNSLVFGLLTFAIPMLLGVVVARQLLSFSWPAAFLLASMFASHTLLAYPVVARLGITRNPAVTAAIGGTIITDTLALLVLAIVAAAVAGVLSTGFWILTGTKLILFVLAVIVGIPPLARWYFHRFSDHGTRDFAFVLAIGFLAAYLALLAGLEAIIGAFLGGLALNRSIPQQSPLMNRVQFTGNAIFVPFFLISVGMLVNVRMILSDGRVALVGSAMVLTVIAGKWLAAMLARRWLGFSQAEGRVMFGLSLSQAAATLAAVFVGFRIGVFGDEVLNGAILMILATCLIAPLMVDRFGRELALAEERAPLKPGERPLRILIPLANPDSAPALMDLAFMIRRPQSPEPILPLTVADQGADVAKQVANSERMLGHAVFYASSAGVPVQPVTRIDTNVANGISRAVAELRASTIVIGWTGSAPKRGRGLGSVLDQLLQDNAQAMLVCRLLHPVSTTQRIVVMMPPLIDREPGFGETIRTLKQLARQLSASIHFHAAARDLRQLEASVNRIRPLCPTQFSRMPTDVAMEESLGAEPDEHDLVVLLSTREGRLAWTPALQRLPLQLSQRFAQSNLVLFFSSEYDPIAEVAGGPISLLAPSRCGLKLVATDFQEAAIQLLTPYLHDIHQIQAAARALNDMAVDAPLELSAGLVLVHAHVDGVDRPLVFFSTLATPIQIGNLTEVEVIVLLLSPKSLQPEQHLRTLASLAKLLQGETTVERLRHLSCYEDLCAALAETESGGEGIKS